MAQIEKRGRALQIRLNDWGRKLTTDSLNFFGDRETPSEEFSELFCTVGVGDEAGLLYIVATAKTGEVLTCTYRGSFAIDWDPYTGEE